jgi:hypothetical protein
MTVTALPRLLWQVLRYRCLRGGWLPGYLGRRSIDWRKLAADRAIDVIVVIADHFEPPTDRGEEAAVEAVASWCADYEALAGRHRDADGRVPQHTWFYPAEYPNFGCLRELSSSVFRGFGEIEFQLHHGPDNHQTFAAKLEAGLSFFNQAGAMLTAETEPRRRFAYVAGNWSLDNGAGDPRTSGCDTEIAALRDAGCYVDCTFPALGSRAQPRATNAIYYASDGPEPKSYDSGIEVEVGRAASGDLMIFQGPLALDWRTGWFDWGPLESYAPPAPHRLHCWLEAHVHVKGRPEWIFVKLHTHGLQSRTTFLSPALDTLFENMAKSWNQPPFRLHYCTAREAYNMIKAAEAGHDGDPNLYRNFHIAPPANRLVSCATEIPRSMGTRPPVRYEILSDSCLGAHQAQSLNKTIIFSLQSAK